MHTLHNAHINATEALWRAKKMALRVLSLPEHVLPEKRPIVRRLILQVPLLFHIILRGASAERGEEEIRLYACWFP